MKKQLKAALPPAEHAEVKKPTFIMAMTVKAGRKSDVFIEADVKGEIAYMPLTPEGARKIAADLIKAAMAVDPMPGLVPGKKSMLFELLDWLTKGQLH